MIFPERNPFMSATSSTPGRHAPVSRACDRCRRRKAKCDFAEPGSGCTHCEDAGAPCTFALPTGKRGPKSRRNRLNLPGRLPLEGSPPSTPRGPEPGGMPVSVQHAPPLQITSTLRLGGATWDAVDPALSPQQATPGSVSDRDLAQLVSSFQRWDDLAAAIQCQAPSLTVENIARQCLDLFFEYLYPLTPLVHEPSLRAALDFFVARHGVVVHTPDPAGSQLWNSPTQTHRSPHGDEVIDSALARIEAWPEPTFTLITAVCAEAAFLLPKEVFPEGYLVAGVFLQASRACLQSYLEADLENPTESSVAIRYFHSNCLHAAGKPKFSWHIFGEAVRLAQVMDLHDESSHKGLFPIEAELRRRAFWIVYLGDKSAALLNRRPITIHKFSFESGITSLYPSGAGDENPVSPGQMETEDRPSLIVGFNANIRLWQSASDLLLELRLIQDRRTDGPGPHYRLAEEGRLRIDSLYVRFATCLDSLPPYLQPESLISQGEQTGLTRQFVIQAANLQVTYHCLRMVITQRFEEIGYFTSSVESTDILVLRKTDIARDMLRIIRGAPFWALQVNGEPCVEKIRLVGASLLAIIHRNETSPLSSRAHSDFTILLDILARLDSKASDTLRTGSPRIV
ncbi:hypothetical protein CONLIGDRAFT_623792 [Coniochaeta ligniaria NRRL 30616]|uniref:Zn(2)-C6 fungal-type domain-containing protein n=1 Tax=Coniochaeta ligniaria NRRL 30616 TaxID=1408157 RepID=A0A1J7IUI6_9PEZI|nr:hypothetical protein CONLIGDRAFT_623792 [Coniochaeta ligniaria NRRL 30616]